MQNMQNYKLDCTKTQHGGFCQALLPPRLALLCRYIGALGVRVICDNIPGLVNKQRQLCQQHPDLMQSVGEGAGDWIRECQHQFRHHRWNCSTLDRDHSVFGRIMLRSECCRDFLRGKISQLRKFSSSLKCGLLARVCMVAYVNNKYIKCINANITLASILYDNLQ